LNNLKIGTSQKNKYQSKSQQQPTKKEQQHKGNSTRGPCRDFNPTAGWRDVRVALDGRETPAAARAFAALADASGAAGLWVSCHLFQRDPAVAAAMLLAGTRRVTATLMAISPFAVHPVYAAMTAATLDEYFPGRVQLCFGVGAPKDLEAAGIQVEAPVDTLREAIEITRALFAGERIDYAGQRYRLGGRALLNAPRAIPIWLAASGPRMLELAGTHADGVLISGGTAPAFVRWSLDHVARGEQAAGRTVRKAAWSTPQSTTTPKPRTTRCAAAWRSCSAARTTRATSRSPARRSIRRRSLRVRARDWAQVDALTTAEIMRNHTAAGTPDEARAAFARLSHGRRARRHRARRDFRRRHAAARARRGATPRRRPGMSENELTGGTAEDRAAILKQHRLYLEPTPTWIGKDPAGIWSGAPDAFFFNLNGHTYRGREHWTGLWKHLKGNVTNGIWERTISAAR